MGKHFILTTLFCAALSVVPAFSASPEYGVRVFLSVRILDPQSAGTVIPRGPACRPTMWLSNHWLLFGDFGEECTLEVLTADGDVCYSAFLMPGDTSCELPVSLSGDYTIVLRMENVEYWGEIIL